MRENNTDFSEASLLAGIHPVQEVLELSPETVDSVLIREGRRGREIDRIIALCRAAKVRFNLTNAAALDRLFPGNHQGVVARVFSSGFVEYEDLLARAADAPLPLIVALDQVQDPGNVGALARTLYGLGAGGLVVLKHGGAALGAAAVRASAGTLARLSVARVTNLAQALDVALDAGMEVYAAGGELGPTEQVAPSEPAGRATGAGAPRAPLVEDAFVAKLRLPAVLVLGNEEHGIRPNVLKRCSVRLRIPLQRGLDSLNVAQAGAILTAMFAAKR